MMLAELDRESNYTLSQQPKVILRDSMDFFIYWKWIFQEITKNKSSKLKSLIFFKFSFHSFKILRLYLHTSISKDIKHIQISIRCHNPEYIIMHQDPSANYICEHVSHALLSPSDTHPTHDPVSLLMERGPLANGNQTWRPDKKSHTLEDVLEKFHDKIK